jgi:hypothetical protein
MSDLEAKFISYNILLLAAGCWILMWSLKKVWPGLDAKPLVRSLKPLYVIIFAQGMAWVPGVLPGIDFVGEKILVALWAAFLSMFGYQILKRVADRYGIKLPDNPTIINGTNGTPPDATKSTEKNTEDDDADDDDDTDDDDADEEKEPEKDPDDKPISSNDRVTPIETPVPKRFAATPIPEKVSTESEAVADTLEPPTTK